MLLVNYKWLANNASAWLTYSCHIICIVGYGYYNSVISANIGLHGWILDRWVLLLLNYFVLFCYLFFKLN